MALSGITKERYLLFPQLLVFVRFCIISGKGSLNREIVQYMYSLVSRLSGWEERESLANFIVTFRSGCPLFFKDSRQGVQPRVCHHPYTICRPRCGGYTPCSYGQSPT